MDANSNQVYDVVADNTKWNQRVVKFSLPPGVDILMGDVCCGAESPSMVTTSHSTTTGHDVIYLLSFRPVES